MLAISPATPSEVLLFLALPLELTDATFDLLRLALVVVLDVVSLPLLDTKSEESMFRK